MNAYLHIFFTLIFSFLFISTAEGFTTSLNVDIQEEVRLSPFVYGLDEMDISNAVDGTPLLCDVRRDEVNAQVFTNFTVLPGRTHRFKGYVFDEIYKISCHSELGTTASWQLREIPICE